MGYVPPRFIPPTSTVQEHEIIPLDEGWMVQRYKPFRLSECWPISTLIEWIQAIGNTLSSWMIREDDDLDSIRWPIGENGTTLPTGDSFQALADSLYLMANAGKISIAATHQEIEPYIPPVPLPTYDIVMSDDYEVSRDEEEPVQQMIPPPQIDEKLIGRDYY